MGGAGARARRLRRAAVGALRSVAVFPVGFNTRWTPVQNLTFTGEVQYVRLDQNFAGTASLAPAAPMPSTTYEFKDQNTVLLQVRAQRNF